MLEPRKLAARSVAMRMADMLQEPIGKTIGYSVRFDHVKSAETRCEVVTEGILTRMIQQDNMLEDVGLVIFDEFHERSLNADLALALCCQVQQILRPDLKILIMSATLDTDNVAAVMNNAPTVTSHGRQYPVSIIYFPGDKENIVASAVRAVLKALRSHSGDVLVFLPGAAEIHRAQATLENDVHDAIIYPLYGNLPFSKQQQAITPHPKGSRKIVLSTSIAETSLTIEGIGVVIDPGFSRVPKFDPRSGLSRLETVRVTKDSADQRAGRAGRLGPGVCYRLWNEATHHNLIPTRQPEILDADLSSMILELANWGIYDMSNLSWITPPPAGAVSQAKELLQQLGAIQDNVITTRGKKMLKLPTHPRIAHMLLLNHDNLPLATDIAALLEERDPLEKNAGADLCLRIDALRKWRSGQSVNADRAALERIEKLAASWRKIFNIKTDNVSIIDSDAGSLVAEAYPERIARQIERHGVRYKLTNARTVRLQDHDPLLRESWLAIALLDSGLGEGRIFMAAPMHEDDLLHRAVEMDVVSWNKDKGMITGVKEKRIGNVVLSSQPLTKIDDDRRINILCQAVRDQGLRLIGWTEIHELWQSRILSLRAWRPNDGWPDVTDENLLAIVEDWLGPYLTGVTRQQDFNKLDLVSILSGILPWDLTGRLDLLAPSRIQVPSGSMIRINYKADGSAPYMEVRLQEVFGLLETPSVNEGRTSVLLHLLSPGFKPVQVTQDLKSFWQTTYHEVRKEMRMRYPRHHWPEDPWTAEAVRGAKKRS